MLELIKACAANDMQVNLAVDDRVYTEAELKDILKEKREAYRIPFTDVELSFESYRCEDYDTVKQYLQQLFGDTING